MLKSKKIVRKLKKVIFISFVTLLPLLLIAFFSLFLWFGTGPREIPFTAQIEESLSALSDDYNVTINKSFLKWNGVTKGLDFRVDNITLKNKEGKDIASFPKVAIGIDFDSLLLGKVEVTSLDLQAPEFVFSFDGEKQPYDLEKIDAKNALEINPISLYRNVIMDILAAIEKNKSQIPLEEINMSHVRIIVNNGKRDFVWFVPEISTRFMLVGDVVTFKNHIEAKLLGKILHVSSEGFIEDKKYLRVRSEVENFSASMAGTFVQSQTWLSRMADVPFDGFVSFLLDENGALSTSDFEFHTQKYSKEEISISGSVDLHKDYKDYTFIPEVRVKVDIKNVNAESISSFWPDKYAPAPRKWVLNGIKKGLVEKSSAKLHIKPDDVINKKLSEDALSAELEFSGVSLDYFGELPNIDDGRGKVYFDGTSMDLFLQSAKIGESDLSDGRVKILDFANPEKVRIEIVGDYKGIVKDIDAFLEMSDELKDKAVDGRIEGDFSLKFPIAKKLQYKDFDLSIDSKLTNLVIPSFRENISINDSDLALVIFNNNLKLNGKVLLNSSYANLKYEEDLNTKISSAELTTILTSKEIESFGTPKLDFISGELELDVKYNSSKKGKEYIGKISAKNAEIDHKMLGFKKGIDKSAMLSFSAFDDYSKFIKITGFQFIGDDFIISGLGKMHPSFGEGTELQLENVKYGKNDFSLRATKNAKDSYRLNMKGKSLDISPFFSGSGVVNANKQKQEVTAKEDGGDQKKPVKQSGGQVAINLSLEVDKIESTNGVIMNDVTALLNCNFEFCEHADLVAKFDKGGELDLTFGVDSTRPDNRRYLVMRTDNAGELIGGLGILKDVIGGKMELSAVAEIGAAGLKEGKIIAKKFSVVNAPILAKLLAIGSFTGMVELLEGKGVTFKKLSGEFSITDKVLKVKRIKTAGSSIGITVDGDIDFNKSHIHVDGAIIPSYTINSFLGNIPLIGTIFVGKEGEGIIATRYKITGDFADPEVSVNPFSMFTPGIFRNIWGGKALEEEGRVIKERKQKQEESQ